jgi:transcriptional regulator with XRE-family HTH domain
MTHPLREFREKQTPPLSQDQLGDLLGVTRETIARWETGVRKPDVTSLPKIAEVTGIPASELRPDIAAQMGAA